MILGGWLYSAWAMSWADRAAETALDQKKHKSRLIMISGQFILGLANSSSFRKWGRFTLMDMLLGGTNGAECFSRKRKNRNNRCDLKLMTVQAAPLPRYSQCQPPQAHRSVRTNVQDVNRVETVPRCAAFVQTLNRRARITAPVRLNRRETKVKRILQRPHFSRLDRMPHDANQISSVRGDRFTMVEFDYVALGYAVSRATGSSPDKKPAGGRFQNIILQSALSRLHFK